MHRPDQRETFIQPKFIKVIEGPKLRSGTSTAVGFIPAGALIPDGYIIPWFDTRSKKGYQRLPQDPRINQLAGDLRKDRTDLPTAVLLNIRNVDERHIIKDGRIQLANGSDPNSQVKFYIVDGQHRILALRKLMDEDKDRWAHFMVPFVCLLGATEEEEMTQFYIVNSTAKSVKTDLALSLLRRRADTDADVYQQLQERGREWQVDGQKVVERLATESGIWKGRIRLPSMEKGETTISSTSLVSSLKPLLSSPYFKGLRPEIQLKVLDAFWHGVRSLLRPVFDAPTEHVIQKGVGVIVMHAILPDVLERVRSLGLSTVEPASYAQILKDVVSDLEGENAEGNPVRGLEFWATAPRGAAGSYSSSAGRRVLQAKLRQLLPEIESD